MSHNSQGLDVLKNSRYWRIAPGPGVRFTINQLYTILYRHVTHEHTHIIIIIHLCAYEYSILVYYIAYYITNRKKTSLIRLFRLFLNHITLLYYIDDRPYPMSQCLLKYIARRRRGQYCANTLYGKRPTTIIILHSIGFRISCNIPKLYDCTYALRPTGAGWPWRKRVRTVPTTLNIHRAYSNYCFEGPTKTLYYSTLLFYIDSCTRRPTI